MFPSIIPSATLYTVTSSVWSLLPLKVIKALFSAPFSSGSKTFPNCPFARLTPLHTFSALYHFFLFILASLSTYSFFLYLSFLSHPSPIDLYHQYLFLYLHLYLLATLHCQDKIPDICSLKRESSWLQRLSPWLACCKAETS